MRAEIYETITEIYRADQQLPVLIKQIEDEHPNDFQRLALLGALYEETGDGANGPRDLQEGARGQSEAHRPPPQDDPRAPVAGRARQGDRRVRGAHPRGAEQPAVRLRAVRGAHAARRSRAGAEAPHRARGARPERRGGALAPRRLLRAHRRERALAQGAHAPLAGRRERSGPPRRPRRSLFPGRKPGSSPSRRGSASSPR